jgi:hypothetical protein
MLIYLRIIIELEVLRLIVNPSLSNMLPKNK